MINTDRTIIKKFTLTLTILITTVIILSAQWQQTNGPIGGHIQSIAINGTNIFAGTDGGGVFSVNRQW